MTKNVYLTFEMLKKPSYSSQEENDYTSSQEFAQNIQKKRRNSMRTLNNQNTEKIREILQEFKAEIKQLYGRKLKNVLLYGSWARGDATEDSDMDLVVTLDGSVTPGKEIDRMIDIITDVNLKHGVLISVYPVSESDYVRVNSPLLMNIRREGVPV